MAYSTTYDPFATDKTKAKKPGFGGFTADNGLSTGVSPNDFTQDDTLSTQGDDSQFKADNPFTGGSTPSWGDGGNTKVPAPGSAPAAGAPATGSSTPGQPGLFSTPGTYEQWVKDHLGEFDQPWATESMGGSAYDDWYAKNKDAFANPGQREGISGDIISRAFGVQGPSFNFSAPSIGAGREAYGIGKEQLSGPGATEQRYADMGDSFNDPGNLEAWYAKYGEDPMQKGYTENLYEQGSGRLDPFYGRAQDLAITGAQRASSARGGFNSGLAAQQESDITGNIRGQQAQQTEALAPIADAERRARYDQGANFANMTDAERQARIQAAFGLSKDTDTAKNQRLSTLGNLAGTADQGTAAEGQIGLGAAKAASDAQYQSGQLQLQGLGVAEDAAAGADESARNRYLDAGGAAKTGDQLSLDRAQAIDAAHGNRLGEAGGFAKGAQAAGEDRIQTMIQGIAGQDSREAALLTNIYGDMSSVDKVDETWLQAEAEKYGVSLEQMKDYASALGKVVDIGVKAIA